MSEKPESEDFEDEEDENVAEGAEEVEVDRVIRDLELAKRRGPKVGEPAWRRLERLLEEKRTAELTSDFDDYEIGDADEGARSRGKRGNEGHGN
jgi:hypothetical protein